MTMFIYDLIYDDVHILSNSLTLARKNVLLGGKYSFDDNKS